MERLETIVVGGGQAGLATSYYLTQHAHEHIVLERAPQAATTWRNERWDSFTLVTPNWGVKMPGAEYDGPHPDAYMPRDEVVAYFERYVDRFRLPVQYETRVLSVESLDGFGYRVRTDEETLRASNVVIATGFEQYVKIPSFASGLPAGITQLPSNRYRNPESLPSGAVLVVGCAQSGAQIAEDLYRRGRQVFLATGSSSGRAPRRYRGRDMFAWLYDIGFFDLTPNQMPFPREHFAAPHLSGAGGGHTLNLHRFARDGVTLLGHLRGTADGKIRLAPDLHENLTRIDGFEQQARKMVDGYIRARGLDVPPEEIPQLRDGYSQPIVEELDLTSAGIGTIIWATGYGYDYGLVKLPVLDADGFPIQTRGVTGFTGLYFVGMPWMPALRSGILAGVGDAAKHIASHIVETSSHRGRIAGTPVAVGSAAARVA
ncbi:MAG TPA: NAD(P)-binding domain-containing protein [Thermomicrobiales bacterium]